MKLKKIIPFLSILCASPLLMAFGRTKEYIEYTDKYDVTFTELGDAGSNNIKYSVLIENPTDGYLLVPPFCTNNNEYKIVRPNNPLYESDYVVMPKEKCEFVVVLPEDVDVNTYCKTAVCYTNKDDDARVYGMFNLIYDNAYEEGFDRYWIDTNDNIHSETHLYVIVFSYEGLDYYALCNPSDRLYLNLNKNTNPDDITIHRIEGLKLVDNSSGNWFATVFFGILFAMIAPFFIIAVIIITIVIIIVKKTRKPKKVENHDDYNNYSGY